MLPGVPVRRTGRVLWMLLCYNHNWDVGTKPLLVRSWNGGWKGKVSLVDTHRISLEHSMAFLLLLSLWGC